ncbi:unnamed protein product, partial [Amoebophrya sp. A120]|eukprot:GSA120T00010256001.1
MPMPAERSACPERGVSVRRHDAGWKSCASQPNKSELQQKRKTRETFVPLPAERFAYPVEREAGAGLREPTTGRKCASQPNKCELLQKQTRDDSTAAGASTGTRREHSLKKIRPPSWILVAILAVSPSGIFGYYWEHEAQARRHKARREHDTGGMRYHDHSDYESSSMFDFEDDSDWLSALGGEVDQPNRFETREQEGREQTFMEKSASSSSYHTNSGRFPRSSQRSVPPTRRGNSFSGSDSEESTVVSIGDPGRSRTPPPLRDRARVGRTSDPQSRNAGGVVPGGPSASRGAPQPYSTPHSPPLERNNYPGTGTAAAQPQDWLADGPNQDADWYSRLVQGTPTPGIAAQKRAPAPLAPALRDANPQTGRDENFAWMTEVLAEGGTNGFNPAFFLAHAEAFFDLDWSGSYQFADAERQELVAKFRTLNRHWVILWRQAEQVEEKIRLWEMLNKEAKSEVKAVREKARKHLQRFEMDSDAPAFDNIELKPSLQELKQMKEAEIENVRVMIELTAQDVNAILLEMVRYPSIGKKRAVMEPVVDEREKRELESAVNFSLMWAKPKEGEAIGKDESYDVLEGRCLEACVLKKSCKVAKITVVKGSPSGDGSTVSMRDAAIGPSKKDKQTFSCLSGSRTKQEGTNQSKRPKLSRSSSTTLPDMRKLTRADFWGEGKGATGFEYLFKKGRQTEAEQKEVDEEIHTSWEVLVEQKGEADRQARRLAVLKRTMLLLELETWFVDSLIQQADAGDSADVFFIPDAGLVLRTLEYINDVVRGFEMAVEWQFQTAMGKTYEIVVEAFSSAKDKPVEFKAASFLLVSESETREDGCAESSSSGAAENHRALLGTTGTNEAGAAEAGSGMVLSGGGSVGESRAGGIFAPELGEGGSASAHSGALAPVPTASFVELGQRACAPVPTVAQNTGGFTAHTVGSIFQAGFRSLGPVYHDPVTQQAHGGHYMISGTMKKMALYQMKGFAHATGLSHLGPAATAIGGFSKFVFGSAAGFVAANPHAAAAIGGAALAVVAGKKIQRAHTKLRRQADEAIRTTWNQLRGNIEWNSDERNADIMGVLARGVASDKGMLGYSQYDDPRDLMQPQPKQDVQEARREMEQLRAENLKLLTLGAERMSQEARFKLDKAKDKLESLRPPKRESSSAKETQEIEDLRKLQQVYESEGTRATLKAATIVNVWMEVALAKLVSMKEVWPEMKQITTATQPRPAEILKCATEIAESLTEISKTLETTKDCVGDIAKNRGQNGKLSQTQQETLKKNLEQYIEGFKKLDPRAVSPGSGLESGTKLFQGENKRPPELKFRNGNAGNTLLDSVKSEPLFQWTCLGNKDRSIAEREQCTQRRNEAFAGRCLKDCVQDNNCVAVALLADAEEEGSLECLLGELYENGARPQGELVPPPEPSKAPLGTVGPPKEYAWFVKQPSSGPLSYDAGNIVRAKTPLSKAASFARHGKKEQFEQVLQWEAAKELNLNGGYVYLGMKGHASSWPRVLRGDSNNDSQYDEKMDNPPVRYVAFEFDPELKERLAAFVTEAQMIFRHASEIERRIPAPQDGSPVTKKETSGERRLEVQRTGKEESLNAMKYRAAHVESEILRLDLLLTKYVREFTPLRLLKVEDAKLFFRSGSDRRRLEDEKMEDRRYVLYPMSGESRDDEDLNKNIPYRNSKSQSRGVKLAKRYGTSAKTRERQTIQTFAKALKEADDTGDAFADESERREAYQDLDWEFLRNILRVAIQESLEFSQGTMNFLDEYMGEFVRQPPPSGDASENET